MNESLINENVKTFGMHQTFTPRLRWLVKTVTAVDDDPRIFFRSNAPSVLGVGKNMVTSMAHWSQAFKLISPANPGELAQKTDGENSRGSFCVTQFGSFLLDPESGVDPFLEKSESIWLLHWALLRGICRVPVWWITFNSCELQTFTISDLEMFCNRVLAESDWHYDKPMMVSRDLDCLLRMYSNRQVSRRSNITDVAEEPFNELGLIHFDAVTKRYRFNWNPKPHLTSLLIVFFMLDQIDQSGSSQKTWSVSSFSQGPSSLSNKLRISHDQLVEALVEVAGSINIHVVFPAGVPQIVITETAGRSKSRVLQLLYPAASQSFLAVDLFEKHLSDANGKSYESRKKTAAENLRRVSARTRGNAEGTRVRTKSNRQQT